MKIRQPPTVAGNPAAAAFTCRATPGFNASAAATVASRATRDRPATFASRAIIVVAAAFALLATFGGTAAAAPPAPEAAAPAPATHTLTLRDGSLAYDDSGGSGPLVLCVPGMGDVRAQYRFLAPLLARAGFRVVTMDLRGLGASSTGWPDYSAAAVGADMVAMIRHLGAKQAYIIGNSMAGAAAVWAAAQDPADVAGIVLIDPFAREMPTPMPAWQHVALKVGMIRPWGPAFWTAYYGSLYKSAPPADLDAYRAALKANLAEPGRLEALDAMLWASKAPCEARISEVRSPVLVVMGTKDSDFPDPVSEANWVATHLHGSKLMVDGAGHYPHVEYPQVVAPAIIQFMKEARDGSRSGT